MRVKKYIQMPEKAFVALSKAFKVQCCDCGLVHSWEMVHQKGIFGFIITRDNRATSQVKRKKIKSREKL